MWYQGMYYYTVHEYYYGGVYDSKEGILLLLFIYTEDEKREVQHSTSFTLPQSSKLSCSAVETAGKEVRKEGGERKAEEKEGGNVSGKGDLQQWNNTAGGDVSSATSSTVQPLSQEELRKKRLKHLEK